MDIIMAIVALLVIIVSICSALLRWNATRYRTKGLPPGTMGWPIFGETVEFLKQGPDFMKYKQSRYGSFFKTHILGSPTIVSLDPEVNRYILMNEAKGLVAGYPQAMLDMLGHRNIAAVHGASHRLVRGSLLYVISAPMLRDHILPAVDAFMRPYLSGWDELGVIDIQFKAKRMAFLSSLKQCMTTLSKPLVEEFTKSFFMLVEGTISVPVNLPGTRYYRGVKARKNIDKIVTKVMEERRASAKTYTDILGYLMKTEDNRYPLTDDEIRDQIITLLYSGYETVSTTSMMSLKYLHDHPKALEEFRREHLAIREKKGPEEALTLEDMKSMTFTRAVIFETSRLATIVNGLLRKTTHDLELNGHLIPKGWRIYVYTRELNYNSTVYDDPFTFNPWRWLEKNLESHINNLLFGGGIRLCPGKELGIVEVSAFLHHFAIRYKWEEVEGNKVMKFPRVFAPDGFKVRVSSI